MTDQDIIKRISAGHWVKNVDGFVVYWPPNGPGCYSAHFLRAIADELDRRNAPMQAAVDAYFSENPVLLNGEISIRHQGMGPFGSS